MPIDKFRAAGCHLRLEFRHCSVKDRRDGGDKKLFGFAWLELMRHDDTVVLDGVHELQLYKCDDPDRLSPGLYLGGGEEAHYGRSSKESVTVHTLLCSTKLTQNLDLMTLLKWRAYPADWIPDIQ